LLAAANPADAASYYMSPTGSDSAAGTLASPWKSYKRAQSALKPGDTLFARGGTYLKCAGGCGSAWTKSGTATAPITFRNYPGETPVFDGGKVGTTPGQGYFLILDAIAHLHIKGLKVTKWCSQWGDGAIEPEDGSHDILLEGNHFVDNGCDKLDHHIYVAGDPTPWNITIRGNYFGKVSGAAIHCYNTASEVGCAKNLVIENNFFDVDAGQTADSGPGYDGVILRHKLTDVTVRHNTFVNSDIDIGGAVTKVKIHNNVCYASNGHHCLSTWGFNKAELVEHHNLWHATDGTPFSGWSKSTTRNNIYTNPLFEGGSLTTHKLSTSSPAIDKADPASSVPNDYDGQTRPMGSAPDMGADEVR
jgi:hypothetical protein